MNPLSSLGRAYLRLRHSKGFGVHSPFAFNLITTAISPPRGYGYYAYPHIDIRSHSRLEAKETKLLLRIADFLNVKRIFFMGEEAYIYATLTAELLRLPLFTLTNKSVSPSSGDIIVISVKSLRLDLSTFQDAGASILLCGRDTLSSQIAGQVSKPREHGLLLVGTRHILAVPNQDMKFVSYTIRF